MSTRTAEQELAFEDLVHEIKELQPLPAIARRLLVMAADDRFSAQDLGSTVSADQALTLKILRLANSPTFGLPRRITTLREAIVLLGFREVRSMALAACMIDAADAEIIRESLLDYDEFWMNSLIIGLVTQVLAQGEGGDRDEAFAAGIVHNVGRLAWAQRRPMWLRATVTRAREVGQPVHDVQRQVLGFTDAETGAAIARNWSFPERLCEAVAHHTMPLSFFSAPTDLDALVARSRRFARAHGLTDGIDEPSGLAPDQDWMRSSVANALRRAGYMDGILRRAHSFFGDTLAA